MLLFKPTAVRTFTRTAALSMLCLFLAAAYPQAYAAGPTIKINFSSTADYTESDGVKGTATASGLTDAQKAAVIALVQKEYDDALGKGVVTVSEGSGGTVDMIVDGSQAPGVNKGKEYGDAGTKTGPGIVHAGEFVNQGFTGEGLTNGIGESVAHEAGHKFGLGHTKGDNTSKMAGDLPIGDKAANTVRKNDNRKFVPGDVKKLKAHFGLKDGAAKDGIVSTDLGVFVGQPVSPISDDNPLEASASFVGSAGAQFGYTSRDGEFVLQGDTTTSPSEPLTFFYGDGLNLAVQLGPFRYQLSDGSSVAQYMLTNPNPMNPRVLQTAIVTFNTESGTATLTLNAHYGPSTGGFFRPTGVPPPSPSPTPIALPGAAVVGPGPGGRTFKSSTPAARQQ
jgi:hypothetical protein